MTTHTKFFIENKDYFFAIAYRMLGTKFEAEDILQDSYLKFIKIPFNEIKNPKALLSKIVTRSSIDFYKSSRKKREVYRGIWLPEPITRGSLNDFDQKSELDESISIAFLHILESLNPIERACFILRDVFDFDYSEISEVTEKSIVNCRKIVERSRNKVTKKKKKYTVNKSEIKKTITLFMNYVRKGETEAFLELLSDDIKLFSDGGGKVSAAINIIEGSKKVQKFIYGLANKNSNKKIFPIIDEINNKPGIIFYDESKNIKNITCFEIVDEKICEIRIIVNPDKLKSIYHKKLFFAKIKTIFVILKYYFVR